MRTVTKWLVAIASGLAAQPVIATEFKEIQVWIGGGITGHYSGFSALADGTLAIVKKKHWRRTPARSLRTCNPGGVSDAGATRRSDSGHSSVGKAAVVSR